VEYFENLVLDFHVFSSKGGLNTNLPLSFFPFNLLFLIDRLNNGRKLID
jgi:hypothetical protein